MERFEFSKLGDALRFGMQNELPGLLKSNSSDNGIYFYGSLSYMLLHGFISNYTASIIERIVLISCIRRTGIEDGIKSISTTLFSELIDKYSFDNIEELFEIFNEQEIPEWCFYIGKQIVDNCETSPFVYDGNLYFISKVSGKYVFANISTERIDEDTRLNDEVDIKIIGYGYDNILGFDDKLKRAYLSVVNQEEFFHCYDLTTDSFIIYPYKFLELCDNVPYVITKDMYVAYLLKERLHKICECHDYERYSYDSDTKCFNVFPKGVETKFFYPFKLTVEGKRKDIDDIVCQKYIWKELKNVVDSKDSSFSFLKRIKEEGIDVPMPKEFSVEGIMGNFIKYVSDSKRCTNKRYIVFENIMDIIESYVDKSEDITRLLYVLYDADRFFKMDFLDAFPSEQLYWRVKEISTIPSESKEFKRLFKSKLYDELFDLLTRDVLSLDELQMESEKKESAKIGTFIINGKGFEANVFDKSEGIILGNQILIDTDFSNCSGMVTYDCVDDCYHVISKDVIETGVRLSITHKFDIVNSKVVYCVLPELGKV